MWQHQALYNGNLSYLDGNKNSREEEQLFMNLQNNMWSSASSCGLHSERSSLANYLYLRIWHYWELLHTTFNHLNVHVREKTMDPHRLLTGYSGCNHVGAHAMHSKQTGAKVKKKKIIMCSRKHFVLPIAIRLASFPLVVKRNMATNWPHQPSGWYSQQKLSFKNTYPTPWQFNPFSLKIFLWFTLDMGSLIHQSA